MPTDDVPPTDDTPLTADAPLADIAHALRTGTTTPTAHLDTVRERFAATEPTIRAFVDGTTDDESTGVETDDDTDPGWSRLERAATVHEATWAGPGERPPLYGVPVGVKDVFQAEGFLTRAGSEVPPDVLTGPEATAVTRLRKAGAFVAGKTVTAEFAYAHPGPTRNPHAPGHTPGGSSSGSAAAVAAGVVPLALGTQTVGSVIRPAAFCGIVGVKPSYDRTPSDGVIPVAPSVDTVGLFTQDLAGARRAAGVLYDDWRAGDRPDAPPVVGAVEGPYLERPRERGRIAFERHVESIGSGRLDVRRVDPFGDIAAVEERHRLLVAAEAALSHDEWYPEYGDRYAAETVELIETGLSVGVDDLAAARAGRTALRARIHDVMDERGLDVLVAPAAPGPAPEGIDSTGDPVVNLPWTHAGLPVVGLPASTVDGRPVGVQCVARFGDDERLVGWCEVIHDALSGDATASM
jgi:Asp-tRNA(Asn)/Glu-tRNA(Gln) amidotransferase A subunit family amidase